LGRGEPPKHVKYAPILKNSVAFKETANERLFLMKDLADLSFRSLRNVMTQAKVLFMPRLSRPCMNNKSSLSVTLIVTFLMVLPPTLLTNIIII